jgi:hypothetical protein
MDRVEPRRIILRREREEPRWRKSITDSEDPSRLIPYIDNADPTRTKLRNEIDDPREMKSNTESEEPRVVMP